MLFNEKLKELRKQKGWSQEKLAEKVNVSRQAVTKWEMGDGYPDIENLKIISNIFEKSIDELVKEDFESHVIDEKTESKTIVQQLEKINVSEIIKKIQINTIPIAQIKVVPTKQAEVSAELYSDYNTILSQDIKLKVKQTKSKLNIIVKKNGFFNFIIIGNTNYTQYIKNLNLIVYIPDKYTQNIDVNTISEKIVLESLNMNKIQITSANSAIFLNEVNARIAEISGIEEKIILRNYMGDLDINTVTSNIDIQYKEFNNSIKMSCISSNIKFEFPIDSEYVIVQNGLESNINYCSNNKETKLKSMKKNKIEIDGVDNSITIS